MLGLGEISERAELSREVTERYARALTELGYLELRRSGKYGLGRSALRLGMMAVRIDSLAEVARPWLCWVRARTGFTASLAILDGEDLDYLAWLPSRHAGQAEQAAEWAGAHAAMQTSRWMAGRQAHWSTTAHSRAAGLALLAFTAESDWPARTRAWALRDPKRHSRLRDELEAACEQRYAVRRDRSGVAAAAPVLGVSEPVAAVEVTVFGEQAGNASQRELAALVVEAADGIAEQLDDDSRTGA